MLIPDQIRNRSISTNYHRLHIRITQTRPLSIVHNRKKGLIKLQRRAIIEIRTKSGTRPLPIITKAIHIADGVQPGSHVLLERLEASKHPRSGLENSNQKGHLWTALVFMKRNCR